MVSYELKNKKTGRSLGIFSVVFFAYFVYTKKKRSSDVIIIIHFDLTDGQRMYATD